MRYKNWEYRTEVDDDHDCRKIMHVAVNTATGDKRHLTHTPYEVVSEAAFKAHVDKGFPGRWRNGKAMCNWNNERITA